MVRVTVMAYAVSEFCLATASVLYTARLYTGSPQLVKQVLLDCIGAVIGGTVCSEAGADRRNVAGALFIALLGNS
jgi:ribose/xylose/arabinose/galactoside ABC-type transport system permease subunit